MSKEPIMVRCTDTHICIKAPYDYRETCRAVPGGRWHPDWKCWMWAKGAASAMALLDAFGPKLAAADGGEELTAMAEELRQQQGIKRALTVDEYAATLPDIPGLKGSSWKHQRAAYAFGYPLAGFGCFLGMGLGKSRVNVGFIVNRCVRGAIIQCPKSVVAVWPHEFTKHAEDPDKLLVVSLEGTVAQKTKAAEKAARIAMARGRKLVVVINFESAWREPFCDWAIEAARGGIIDHSLLDEVHKIKAASGKASKFCEKLAALVPFRIGNTGTPLPHSPLDAFGIFRAIDPAVYGTNHHVFKTRYAILGGFGDKQVVGYKNQGEFTARFESISFRAGKEQLDLPPFQDITIPVEMGTKARKILAALEADLFAEIEGGTITAANALVKLLRMQQVTGGYAKLDEEANRPDVVMGGDLGELAKSLGFTGFTHGSLKIAVDGAQPQDDVTIEQLVALFEAEGLDVQKVAVDGVPVVAPTVKPGTVQQVDTAKREALADLIEGMDAASEPVVVFARFTADLDTVREVAEGLGRGYKELSGRLNELAEWQRGEGQVIGVNIRSGGAGVDLTRARYCIYYSMGYSLGDYEQSRDRTHRPGQERPVTYYHLVATKTVDEKVYKALSDHKEVVDYIISGKALRREDEPCEA